MWVWIIDLCQQQLNHSPPELPESYKASLTSHLIGCSDICASSMNCCYVSVPTCTAHTLAHTHSKNTSSCRLTRCSRCNKWNTSTNQIDQKLQISKHRWIRLFIQLTTEKQTSGRPKNERFTSQRTKRTNTSTASRLAKAWDGFVDVGELVAQHAMDSVTRSTIWRLTSQEQHMEKEADGSMTAAGPALTD